MSEDLRIVVTGHSLRGDSRPVVEAGLALAQTLGGRVELVHAYTPLRHRIRVGRSASDLGSWQQLHDGLIAELHSQAEAMGVEDESSVGWHVEAGAPHAVLNEVAESLDADLIVVGPAERGALRRGALGSTVNRLLHTAHRPVWVVRPTSAVPPRRVLAAVDFSTPSLEALHVVHHLLTAMRPPGEAEAELERFTVLTVLEPGAATSSANESPADEAVLDELADRIETHTPLDPATLDLQVRRGDPRDVLVEEVERGQFDLAVLGAHGQAASDRFGMIGRVAHDLARRAPSSVLIVPTAAVWIAAASGDPPHRRPRP